MKLRFENYRFAEEILHSEDYLALHGEVLEILQALPALRRGVAPSEKPANENFPVDQDAMNTHLDKVFKDKGWTYHPPVVEGTKLAADYSKSDVQVEVQFGNMARWTYDIFKFQIAYSKGNIRLGILVVPVRWFARTIGDNIAYFERIQRELPHAELSITLPILVVGLDPSDDEALGPLREKFERQARLEEQWETFLDTWAAEIKQPIRKADLARRIFENDVPKLREAVPEDLHASRDGGNLEAFSKALSSALNRKKVKRRLERAKDSTQQWIVISADEAAGEAEKEDSD